MRRPEDLTREESAIMGLCIGRILRLGSRPTQPGDVAQLNKCVGIMRDIMDEECDHTPLLPPAPGWNFGVGTSGRIE